MCACLLGHNFILHKFSATVVETLTTTRDCSIKETDKKEKAAVEILITKACWSCEYTRSALTFFCEYGVYGLCI